MRIVLTTTLIAAFTGSAASAQSCEQYVGQIVSPISFEQAASQLGNVAPRDEFETTAQYEARLAAASLGGPLIISKAPESADYFEYDADNQVLNVKSYAFHNTGMGWWEAFYSAGTPVEASTLYNIGVVIETSDEVVGTYEAQNGFGAEATIAEIDRRTTAIFEREARSYRERLFINDEDAIIGSIPMDIPTARATKPQLQIAFVVIPRAPYLVEGSHSVGRTTVSNPRDVTEHFRIMIADFQCGLLLDGNSNVIASYETN